MVKNKTKVEEKLEPINLGPYLGSLYYHNKSTNLDSASNQLQHCSLCRKRNNFLTIRQLLNQFSSSEEELSRALKSYLDVQLLKLCGYNVTALYMFQI